MGERYCVWCMRTMGEGPHCPHCGKTSIDYRPSPQHLVPGVVLAGRYLVGRVLGEGGFGITYLARDLVVGVRVAIKEYYPVGYCVRTAPSMEVSAFMGERGEAYRASMGLFLGEADALARMEGQPVAVGVRDFFEANGTAYIVMEYVEGETLRNLVESRGGTLAATSLLPLIEPLFDALAHLHSEGIVHRDIAPDNVMVDTYNRVRLIDFGLARVTRGHDEAGSKTVAVAVKEGFAPLEQYSGHGELGPWTDVYALAATIYWCLCGQAPPNAYDRLAGTTIAPPDGLTPSQAQGLLAALEPQVSARTQTVGELHDALYHPDDTAAPIRGNDIKVMLEPSGKRRSYKVDYVVPSTGKRQGASVAVPKDVSDGAKIRIAGKGDYGSNGGDRGDLVVTIHIVEKSDHSLLVKVLRLGAGVLAIAAVLAVAYVLLNHTGKPVEPDTPEEINAQVENDEQDPNGQDDDAGGAETPSEPMKQKEPDRTLAMSYVYTDGWGNLKAHTIFDVTGEQLETLLESEGYEYHSDSCTWSLGSSQSKTEFLVLDSSNKKLDIDALRTLSEGGSGDAVLYRLTTNSYGDAAAMYQGIVSTSNVYVEKKLQEDGTITLIILSGSRQSESVARLLVRLYYSDDNGCSCVDYYTEEALAAGVLKAQGYSTEARTIDDAYVWMTGGK